MQQLTEDQSIEQRVSANAVRADEVPIGSPCEENWDRMRPEAGGRRRWCEHCERQVHDLSAMGEPAARAFLRATAGQDVCIAYVVDDADELVFGPEIVPLERVRRRPRAMVEAAKLASAASLAALLGACTAHGDPASAEVVEDPAHAQLTAPVVLIPTAGAERASGSVISEEPCEPQSKPPKLIKKGRYKRMGVRLVTDSDPLGGL